MKKLTFNQEQETLKELVVNLTFYILKRDQKKKVRDVSMDLGVSNQNVTSVLSVLELLQLRNDNDLKQLKDLLKTALEEIIELESQLKDRDYYE